MRRDASTRWETAEERESNTNATSTMTMTVVPPSHSLRGDDNDDDDHRAESATGGGAVIHNMLQNIHSRRQRRTNRMAGKSDLKNNTTSIRSRLSRSGMAAIIGDNVVGEVFSTGTINFLNLYNTVLVVRLVSTWFPNIPQSVIQPLR